MKRILHFAVAAGILLTVAVSCKKDDVLFYNDVTFVNAADGVYITDYGLTYNIVENATDKEIPRDGRLILQCDVLKAKGSGVYEVRVTRFAVPLTKEPVPAVTEPDADDALNIENGWFSGGYFNSLIGFYVQKDSETKHLINAEYTLPDETNDTLYIRMRHNAFGEKPVDPEDEADAYDYTHTYACFHLEGLLPEGSEVPAKISWNWYGEKEDGMVTYKEYAYKVKLRF